MIGAWAFIVNTCVLGLCIPNGTFDESKFVDSGMFKTEQTCQITSQLYDSITNAENDWMKYPFYYTKSECFDWFRWNSEK
jgi:hypothetical protein